jgi:hypothetical protein
MKWLYFLIMMILVSFLCFADDEAKGSFTQITPLASYEYLHLEEQQFHSPGEELSFMRIEGQSLFLFQASAKQYFLEQENMAGYEGPYHSGTLMLLQKTGAHQFIAFFDTSSSEPVYGGLRTFRAGIGCQYELIHTERSSLTIGGILAIIDLGVEFDDGKIWPLYPVPSVQYEFKSQFFSASASLPIPPELRFTVLPENKIRLSTTVSFMMKFRDARDIFFDCALWYRFFDADSELGDFAGFGVGTKNSGLSFDFGEKNKSYELQYYSLYGILDLSLVQISGGYCFRGKEIFDSSNSRTLGNGYFVSVSASLNF